MSQRADLLSKYRAVLSAPRDDALRLGAEDCFVQFGPLVVSRHHVLLLGVVTDHGGTVRARDYLSEEVLPHFTLGAMKPGGGWVDESHSRSVSWCIAHDPRALPGLRTPSWSRQQRRSMDMSEKLAELSEDSMFREASTGPVAAQVRFEGRDRFVIAGGPALEVYLSAQRAVQSYC